MSYWSLPYYAPALRPYSPSFVLADTTKAVQPQRPSSPSPELPPPIFLGSNLPNSQNTLSRNELRLPSIHQLAPTAAPMLPPSTSSRSRASTVRLSPAAIAASRTFKNVEVVPEQIDPGVPTQGGQEEGPAVVSSTLWESESTITFQVTVRGHCVARRLDNDYVNCTKLLNLSGMSRGKRDGILKIEKTRVVVTKGTRHLRGVWVSFRRARELAHAHALSRLLMPLFDREPLPQLAKLETRQQTIALIATGRDRLRRRSDRGEGVFDINKTLSHRARGLSSLLDTIEGELSKAPKLNALVGIDTIEENIVAPFGGGEAKLLTSTSGTRLAPLNFSFGTLDVDLGSSHLMEGEAPIPQSATEFFMNPLRSSASPNTLRRFTFPDLNTTSDSLSPAPTGFNKAPRRSLDSRPSPSEFNTDDSGGYSDVSAAMALTLLHTSLTPPIPTPAPSPPKLPSFKIQFCDVPTTSDLPVLSKPQGLPAFEFGSRSRASPVERANFLDDRVGVQTPTMSAIKPSPRSPSQNRSRSPHLNLDYYRSSPHSPPNFYHDAPPPSTKMAPAGHLRIPTPSFSEYSYPVLPSINTAYLPTSTLPVDQRRNLSPSSAYLPPPPSQIWNSHQMNYPRPPPPRSLAPHLFQHEHHHYYHHEVPISPDASNFLPPRSFRPNVRPYDYGYNANAMGDVRRSIAIPYIEKEEIKRARNPSERRDSIGAGIIKEERALNDRGGNYSLDQREYKRAKY